MFRSPRPQLLFNKVDESKNVDRRSDFKIYSVVDGIPQNPVGRTGIIGRGVLPRWGPNHAGLAVVTRYIFFVIFFAILLHLFCSLCLHIT